MLMWSVGPALLPIHYELLQSIVACSVWLLCLPGGSFSCFAGALGVVDIIPLHACGFLLHALSTSVP